jgi:hypothetical protein
MNALQASIRHRPSGPVNRTDQRPRRHIVNPPGFIPGGSYVESSQDVCEIKTPLSLSRTDQCQFPHAVRHNTRSEGPHSSLAHRSRPDDYSSAAHSKNAKNDRRDACCSIAHSGCRPDILDVAFAQCHRQVVERHGGGAANRDCANRCRSKQCQLRSFSWYESPVGQAGAATIGLSVLFVAETSI